MKRKFNDLPKPVFDMLQQGAWLVGSAAAWYVADTSKTPGDFDVLVPPERYQAVLRCLPKGTVLGLTAFGGARAKIYDEWGGYWCDVDFWPMSLEEFTGLASANSVPGPHVAFRFTPHTVLRW